MNWIAIDDFGKYLVLRKEKIDKKSFFDALGCQETKGFSAQNVLYSVFCIHGENTHEIYLSYCKNYDGMSIDETTFLSNYFNISKKLIEELLGKRKDGECCYYVDAVLIDGYSISHLLNPSNEDIDSILFAEKLKEAIKEL